jgi:hypothetical protein
VAVSLARSRQAQQSRLSPRESIAELAVGLAGWRPVRLVVMAQSTDSKSKTRSNVTDELSVRQGGRCGKWGTELATSFSFGNDAGKKTRISAFSTTFFLPYSFGAGKSRVEPDPGH